MNNRGKALTAFFTGVLAIPMLPSTVFAASGAAPRMDVIGSPAVAAPVAPVVAPASTGIPITPFAGGVSTGVNAISPGAVFPGSIGFSPVSLPGQSSFGFAPSAATATGLPIAPTNTGIPITANGTSISTPPGGFATGANTGVFAGSPFGFGFGFGNSFNGWPGPWAALSLYGDYGGYPAGYPTGSLYRQGNQLVSQPAWTYTAPPPGIYAPNPYAAQQCAIRTNSVNTTIQMPVRKYVAPPTYGLAYAGGHKFARVIKHKRTAVCTKKQLLKPQVQNGS